MSSKRDTVLFMHWRPLLRISSVLGTLVVASCTQREARNSSRRTTLEQAISPSTTGASPQPIVTAAQVEAGDSSSVAAVENAPSRQTQPIAAPEASLANDAGSGRDVARRQDRRCHILAIGDSLTDPRSHGGGYLKPWLTRCNQCRVTNIARGGAMVNQMLTGLRRHLTETQETYSHFVVFGGVNDLYSDQTAHRTVAKIERDLSAIYALGRKSGSTVVALTVAPWSGFQRWYTEERGVNTATLNQWILMQKQAGTLDIVVDTSAVLTCGEPTELCPALAKPFRDGLHFGPDGHERLGRSLLDTLGPRACGS